jgi:hypothetical protein
LENALKGRFSSIVVLVGVLVVLAGCDNGAPNTPVVSPTATGVATVEGVPTATESAGRTSVVVTAVPNTLGAAQDTAVVAPPTQEVEEGASPTAVTATGTGQAVTALTALGQLKAKALAWEPDARLVMLANVRPGQAARLLGVALGDPDVNQPTPGGQGRNWALVVFSPSTKGAVAIEMDGTQTDLVKEGALTDEMVSGFGSAGMEALDLSKLDVSNLADSDAVTAKVGAGGQDTSNMSTALLAPDGLGLGPLPTPAAGGEPPQVAYEVFSVDPDQQRFVFFDAVSGAVVMDSATP